MILSFFYYTFFHVQVYGIQPQNRSHVYHTVRKRDDQTIENTPKNPRIFIVFSDFQLREISRQLREKITLPRRR